MKEQEAFERIASSRLIAGMRGQFGPDLALAVCEVLIQEGITNFEFTLNSEKPVEAMTRVKQEFGASACVGMGTVLSVSAAQEVLDAGADFVVSPAFQAHVVQHVMARNVLVAPGVITPSECLAATELGVRMLKIFPIGSLGIGYFKALRGPLDEIAFLCNGGINAENTREFLAAGAVACGLAGWLTGSGDMPLTTIRERARQLRNIVSELQAERSN
ncbi:MAG: bifunctional 4-hydroxy-2-oxoglutarate aldolase/2-dehydro-3-deoxy-phosphogluconate aldolase [Anaerolineaceae bacterium]|nr:bifunctional 4-hydroxy-2-oxoglutarate aldolase/2-dehydro-3-deoxy-phosphogluconate aldolase [Anaerolineaceae bacterium]